MCAATGCEYDKEGIWTTSRHDVVDNDDNDNDNDHHHDPVMAAESASSSLKRAVY